MTIDAAPYVLSHMSTESKFFREFKKLCFLHIDARGIEQKHEVARHPAQNAT
jgi:hypothetical protein